MTFRSFGATALVLAGLILAAQPSQAVTITFDALDVDPYLEDGFRFDVARIVNGNCDAASGRPCMALNDNETSTLTRVGGGVFTLDSFWFQLLGNGTDNALTVTSFVG